MCRKIILGESAYMVVDVVSFGETMFRLTTAPGVRLEHAGQFQIYIGGTESNTLACLSRLNFKTRWLSALPANPMGRRITSELSAHGVDTSHVVWAKDDARLGIFYVEESAQPIGLQVYYDRANSACALVDPDVVDYTLVDDARMLHLTGITPALSERAREVFRRFLDRARARQIPLSFDVNYRAKLWSPSEAATHIENACSQARILICTRADAAELWGITGDAEAVLRQMARRFTGDQTDKTLVLTLGSAGSAQLRGDVYSEEPAFPTTGTMRFGSGDAFAAGYLYSYLEGALYQEMREERAVTPLAFGNALASLKRCIAGDIAIIGPDDVKAVLRQDGAGARFR
jgi:2-dehydro-3-deoxygluconokinase